MSILIKGMEMPKDGTYNIVHIYSDGHVSMPVWGKGMQIVQGVNAVPVPPHGRLIDADALEQDAQKRLLICIKNDNQFQKPYEIMRAIACAPIIIEAEKSECKFWDSESNNCALYRPSVQPEIRTQMSSDCISRRDGKHIGMTLQNVIKPLEIVYERKSE